MQVSMPTSVVGSDQGKISKSKIEPSQPGVIFESIMFLVNDFTGEGNTDSTMKKEAEGLQDLPLLEEDEALVTLNVMNTMPLVEDENLVKLNFLSNYMIEDDVAIPPKNQPIKTDLIVDTKLLESVKAMVEDTKSMTSIHERVDLGQKGSGVEVVESVEKSVPEQSLMTARSFLHSVWLKEKPVTV
ncbi:MAG: hypothetical protein ACRCST_07640, partial [Turicibacter sp.]